MTSDQAREILLRYRPGSSDEDDPEVRAALAEASRDPTLFAWLEEHRNFQHKLQGQFRNLAVPDGLREQILSEKRVRLSLWRSPQKLALAATALLLMVLGFAYLVGRAADVESRFATFRARMVKTALRGYAMDIESSDTGEIREFLKARRAQSDWTSPPHLEDLPLMGCAVLKWQGQPATMICYGRGNQPELWLFVVDSNALPDPPGNSELVYQQVNRLNTVSWSRAGRTYVLAGKRAASELLRLLDGKS